MGAQQGFTRIQIKSLVDALPDCDDSRKEALLPRMLADWAKTDVEEHRSRSLPRTIRIDKKQMEAVARHAAAFDALSNLRLTGSRLQRSCCPPSRVKCAGHRQGT